MQEERNTTPQEEAAPSTDKPKLQIEISRYKGILDMIADTRKLAKLILVMVVVLVLVFLGVTSVVLIVKKFYPGGRNSCTMTAKVAVSPMPISASGTTGERN